MGEPRPFVYIAALRRSGSTVLSELLTRLPTSFIFREPELASGRFARKPDDTEALRALGIDLAAFESRWRGWFRRRVARRRPGALVRGFRDTVAGPMSEHVQQVGVKEIAHSGWQHYQQVFPDMRVIVLGRDPRDIYLSMLDRRDKGVGKLAGQTLPPQRAAELLMPEFERQRAMVEDAGALSMTYERLCIDPAAFNAIAAHIDSPLKEPGRAGAFNESNPQRTDEAALHDGALTAKRIGRWRREENPDRLQAAHQLFDLMRPYAEFWGYEPR